MLKQENKTANEILAVIIVLIGAYILINHDFEKRDPLDTPHVRHSLDGIQYVTSRSSRLPILPYEQRQEQNEEGLYIVINDQAYYSSTTIWPALPIIARFHHSNKAVTRIRMQHPRRPELHLIYPLDQDVRIENHETYIRQGQHSSSEFLALDEQGRIYDRILIEFRPNP